MILILQKFVTRAARARWPDSGFSKTIKVHLPTSQLFTETFLLSKTTTIKHIKSMGSVNLCWLPVYKWNEIALTRHPLSMSSSNNAWNGKLWVKSALQGSVCSVSSHTIASEFVRWTEGNPFCWTISNIPLFRPVAFTLRPAYFLERYLNLNGAIGCPKK